MKLLLTLLQVKYKIRLLWELHVNYYDCCLHFYVCFSDDFFNNDTVNRHNCCYWTKWIQKLNVRTRFLVLTNLDNNENLNWDIHLMEKKPTLPWGKSDLTARRHYIIQHFYGSFLMKRFLVDLYGGEVL